jgi:hypothetical protein
MARFLNEESYPRFLAALETADRFAEALAVVAFVADRATE